VEVKEQDQDWQNIICEQNDERKKKIKEVWEF